MQVSYSDYYKRLPIFGREFDSLYLLKCRSSSVVEHFIGNEKVMDSISIFGSKFIAYLKNKYYFYGDVAQWSAQDFLFNPNYLN